MVVSMERKSFLLRIDAGLWDELEAWAASELRSVNGQVEYILREAVQKRKGPAQSSRLADHKGSGGISSGHPRQRLSNKPRRK
jgi:hypothetical protein